MKHVSLFLVILVLCISISPCFSEESQRYQVTIKTGDKETAKVTKLLSVLQECGEIQDYQIMGDASEFHHFSSKSQTLNQFLIMTYGAKIKAIATNYRVVIVTTEKKDEELGKILVDLEKTGIVKDLVYTETFPRQFTFGTSLKHFADLIKNAYGSQDPVIDESMIHKTALHPRSIHDKIEIGDILHALKNEKLVVHFDILKMNPPVFRVKSTKGALLLLLKCAYPARAGTDYVSDDAPANERRNLLSNRVSIIAKSNEDAALLKYLFNQLKHDGLIISWNNFGSVNRGTWMFNAACSSVSVVRLLNKDLDLTQINQKK